MAIGVLYGFTSADAIPVSITAVRVITANLVLAGKIARETYTAPYRVAIGLRLYCRSSKQKHNKGKY